MAENLFVAVTADISALRNDLGAGDVCLGQLEDARIPGGLHAGDA
jgi:hypothetical protein